MHFLIPVCFLLFVCDWTFASKDDILLVARANEIRWLNRSQTGATWNRSTWLPVRGLENVYTVDYDPREGFVYWSDVQHRSISRARLNGTDHCVVSTTNSNNVYSLTLSSQTKTLYWAERLHEGTIQTSGLDGADQRTLLDGLDRPWAVALHEELGYLYWTSVGAKPSIERVRTDGTDRLAIITRSLSRPTALELDQKTGHLYWADSGSEHIEYSKLDGSMREVLATGMEKLYGLALDGEMLMWPSDLSISRYDVKAGTDDVVVSQLSNPWSLGSTRLANKKDVLYIAGETEIREVVLDGHRDLGRSIVSFEHHEILHIEASPHTGDIYWADRQSKMLHYMTRDGTVFKALNFTDVQYPSGFAFKSKDELYVRDRGNDTIWLCSVTSLDCSLILTDNISSSYELSYDVGESLLFWPVGGSEPLIERASHDGSSRQVIVDTELGTLYGFTLDQRTRTLYWSDYSLDKLERCDYDGSNRRVLVTGPDAYYVWSITILEGSLYWLQRVEPYLVKSVRLSDLDDIALVSDHNAKWTAIRVSPRTLKDAPSVSKKLKSSAVDELARGGTETSDKHGQSLLVTTIVLAIVVVALVAAIIMVLVRQRRRQTLTLNGSMHSFSNSMAELTHTQPERVPHDVVRTPPALQVSTNSDNLAYNRF